ncbi:hypothetical protein HYU93_02715 [Candidatus Daviesbacteria bacterium]|nr:hypothetical protein [Candidatus Daviesbacteria bacterium]
MINFVKKLLNYFFLWKNKPSSYSGFDNVVWVDSIDTSKLPKDSHVFYIAGFEHKAKWLHFNCPSGCGEVISLNLMKSFNPHWELTFHTDKELSVYPSVISTTCGSHFWIEKNKVNWV